MTTILKPLTVAIALSLPFALAQTASETLAKTSITVEEAIAIALDAQSGTIGEAELDQFEGRAAYDIEVINTAGEEIEFKIDANTGEIMNRWTDDDPTDDPADGTGANTDG